MIYVISHDFDNFNNNFLFLIFFKTLFGKLTNVLNKQ